MKDNVIATIKDGYILININNEFIGRSDAISSIRLCGKNIMLVSSKRDYTITFSTLPIAKICFEGLWRILCRKGDIK